MLISCILLSILFSCIDGQLEWQEVPTASSTPDPRRDAGLGFDVTRNQLILFGGRPWTTDDTWIFNISSGTWRSVSTAVHPAARFSFVSGLQGDYFYVSMGEGLNRQFYNDIWRFSLITETWEELSAQQSDHLRYVNTSVLASRDDKLLSTRPEARYGATGGIHSQGFTLFVSQGFSSRRYFDTYSYSVSSQGWSEEYCAGYTCNPYNPSYPHARCLHAGAMAAPHQLVIFGGCLSGGLTGGPCPSGDSWIYNSQTKTWKQIDGCPSPRIYGTMAMVPSVGGKRRLVLYGGKEEHSQVIKTTLSAVDEVFVLDPDNLVWCRQKTKYQTSPPAWRASASMATASTGVYMFGGVLLESGDVTNDLWLLSGTAVDTETAEVLPCAKNFANWILLHGIFMMLGWGCLLIWGAIIARYFNGKGKVWFIFHVSFQVSGLLLATVGVVFAVISVQSKHFMFAHGAIGLLVMLLGFLQPVNACFRGKRPEKGEIKTLRRKIWEILHHFSGYIAIVLAVVNISLGLFFAIAKTEIWSLWYSYLALLLIFILIAEILCWVKKKEKTHSTVLPSNQGSSEQDSQIHVAAGMTNHTNPEFDSELPIKKE
ncbi:uncharacterized protein LOC132548400 [Ylistrum balloti]|uniref:uncharacterized protein LOC132548400 n=1 Tax=Ylistrum balloti TaxID=509963 RepID=UPI0029058452|nr:uncharacterized protein LOC132548400 [Ylistrum balloti]